MAVVHDALGEVDHGAVAAGGEERVEETLGPIAPVATFSTTAQAVADANVTEYGLASYVYAATPDDGRAFAAHLEAGMVGIGTGLLSSAAAPFGGVKSSGLGSEGIAECGRASLRL